MVRAIIASPTFPEEPKLAKAFEKKLVNATLDYMKETAGSVETVMRKVNK